MRIKVGAIPIMNMPNSKSVKQEQCEENIIIKTEILEVDEIFTSGTPDSVGPQPTLNLVSKVDELPQISGNAIVNNVRTMDDLDQHFSVLYDYIQRDIPCTILTYPMESVGVQNEIGIETTEKENVSKTQMVNVTYSTLDSTMSEVKIDCPEMMTPKKKRQFFHPRYISEIQTSHVATPHSASRILKFVKEKYQEKALKIKSLHQEKRCLQNRICSLHELLANLGQQGMISKHAEDSL